MRLPVPNLLPGVYRNRDFPTDFIEVKAVAFNGLIQVRTPAGLVWTTPNVFDFSYELVRR